jgi:hypothetical protein
MVLPEHDAGAEEADRLARRLRAELTSVLPFSSRFGCR